MPARHLVLLVLVALTALLAAPLLSEMMLLPRAASIHVLLAAGVMPLIPGAMLYFAPVLTRSGAPHRLLALLPWAALASGLGAMVSFGQSYAGLPLVVLPALVACLILLGWMQRLKRRCLGSPHPGLYWYQAALLCLALGLGVILLLPWWPQHWQSLKSFHLHINIIGFIGLTAVGTLQVLVPTAGGYSDPGTARRLRRDLPYALGGSLLIAAGAAVWIPLSVPGLGLWLVVLMRFYSSLWRHRQAWLDWHGTAVALAIASLGLGIVLVSGGVHGAGWMAPELSFPLLFFGFLFPLISGAAGYLLPLWRWPGPQTSWHHQARRRLTRGSGLRGGLFLVAALLIAAGYSWAVYVAILGLAFFGLQAAFTLSKRHTRSNN